MRPYGHVPIRMNCDSLVSFTEDFSSFQLEVCQAQPCSARLHVRGEMNGKPIDAELAADLTGDRLEARSALAAEAAWFPYAPLLLAPVAFSVAEEEGAAANGFTLTGGRFLTQSQVSFVTGEVPCHFSYYSYSKKEVYESSVLRFCVFYDLNRKIGLWKKFT